MDGWMDGVAACGCTRCCARDLCAAVVSCPRGVDLFQTVGCAVTSQMKLLSAPQLAARAEESLGGRRDVR